ncbi:MAG: hypothetical protein WEB04_04235 [Dehalococcoidia bacterium]
MSPDVQRALAWLVIFGLPIAGFVAGLLRQRVPNAAVIAAGAVAALYALLLLAAGTWAAACWDCVSDEPLSRGTYFMLALTWGGLFAALVELSVWAGTRVSHIVRRDLSR